MAGGTSFGSVRRQTPFVGVTTEGPGRMLRFGTGGASGRQAASGIECPGPDRSGPKTKVGDHGKPCQLVNTLPEGEIEQAGRAGLSANGGVWREDSVILPEELPGVDISPVRGVRRGRPMYETEEMSGD